jgi:uncharacterized membrane protein YdjX (TVP38/TMEM64 family)/rhodanese-related sulfurtransferase
LNARSAATRFAVAGLLAAAALWAATNHATLDVASIESKIRGLGVWAHVGYIAAYALATVFFLPGALFGLAGGALFGPLWGTVWNLLGATLGATLAFVAARYIASDWVARKAAGRMKQIAEGIDAEGWRFVAVTRLVPLFPFNLLNYALGLTRIPLDHYILASFVCMVPGTAAYTWLGYAGREAAAGEGDALHYGLAALGLLALVAFLPRLIRRSRGKSTAWISVADLHRRLQTGAALDAIDVRSPEEFNGPLGRIPAAVNIPLGEFSARAAELGGATNRPIVLVCRTDKRSAAAAEILSAAGRADVYVLRGGMEDWNRSGLPADGNRVASRSIGEIR